MCVADARSGTSLRVWQKLRLLCVASEPATTPCTIAAANWVPEPEASPVVDVRHF